MKTSLCILLAALMAIMPIQAQITETNAPPPTSGGDNKTDVWWCLLLISAALVGGVLVIYVCSNSCDGSCSNKKLVLERDNLDGNWIAIATNIVGNVCTNKFKVFEDYPRESACRYRVKVYPIN